MLMNFNTQCDLSRCQSHWQEFLSQYKMKIIYIKGKDNSVADALSWLPENCFEDECPEWMVPHEHWEWPIGAVLSIKADHSVLAYIKSGYNLDPFCIYLTKNEVPGTQLVNGLWYVGDHLVIPQVGNLQKNLYWLVHDSLSHFGADKLYASLHDNYYWPNMHTELKKSYIPSCNEANHGQQNPLAPYILYQYQMNVVIVLHWTLSGLSQLTKVTNASCPWLIDWALTYESYWCKPMQPLKMLPFCFSTIGIVKMVYHLIGSPIETSSSCHTCGKHSQSWQV